MNDLRKVLDELEKPFPVDRLKWREGHKGNFLIYVDARDYMNRLDEVALWQDKYEITPQGVAICSIGLKIGDDWVWRSDGAGQTNIEGEKGGFTDAFKRACVKWGLGRYLYYIPGSPDRKLPSWATPEGFEKAKEGK